MTRKKNELFQMELAGLLNRKLQSHRIDKKIFANLLGVSAAYVSRITTKGDKQPTPERLREIITIFKRKFSDVELEKDIEQLVETLHDVHYKVAYHLRKRIETKAADSSKPLAFVIMPFSETVEPIYRNVIKPVIKAHAFDCQLADEVTKTGVSIDQIKVAITGANLVLCDLTYRDRDVFFELGIAQCLEKPTVLISQKPADIPWDIQEMRVIPYNISESGVLKLRRSLADFLKRMFPRDEEIYANNLDELETQLFGLFSNSRERKRYAIRFLGGYHYKPAYDPIWRLAAIDPDPDIKRDAFTALHMIDRERSRSFLISEGLRHQESFLVRERVVQLLGNYEPDEKLLKQMKDQITDSSWGVRRAVCMVLGRWGRSEVIETLRLMIRDPAQNVKLAATQALEGLNESISRTPVTASHAAN